MSPIAWMKFSRRRRNRYAARSAAAPASLSPRLPTSFGKAVCSSRPVRADDCWLADSPDAVDALETGPTHPDYKAFCQGPGHGTGYQDQIIIEAKDFLHAIDGGAPVWPTFADGPLVIITIRSESSTASSTSWVIISTVLLSRAWISISESCICARVNASSAPKCTLARLDDAWEIDLPNTDAM